MSARRWSDEELLDAVRRCAADRGEPLGIATYVTWRRAQTDPTPSEGTIGTRFGGWPAAVEQAGVRTSRTGPKERGAQSPRRTIRFGTVQPPRPS